MKVVFLAVALFAVAVSGEDLICKVGNWLCTLNCITAGHINGYCNEEGRCTCDEPAPEGRTELICLLGGNLGCEINCLTHTGHFAGKCDEENNCVCENKVEESLRMSVAARTELACTKGGDKLCATFCHWITGREEGVCDEQNNCKCL